MKYMTIKEAAAKWGISERLAQQHCIAGRIPGADKFGGAWAIPEDAEKPADPRRDKLNIPADAQTPGDGPDGQAIRRPAMPLLGTSFIPGHALEAVQAIEDPHMRAIAGAEYWYFSGEAEKASEIARHYLTSSDMAMRLSACWIYAYSNLALDRIDRARLAIAHVRDVMSQVDEHTPPEHRALAVCVATGATILLHLPLPENLPPMKQFIHMLPPGLRMFALYVQAHYAYLQRSYGACIGIVETALALEGETYPLPTIYLHLAATMSYMSLKQPDEARRHLLAAWELGRPDDLIEPFGEHHGLLGGMLEAVLKKEWPEDFARVISITYRFSAGWRKIHNPATGHDVADVLTTTEFAAAMLAARGWTNREISEHLGVSPSTVKRYISTVLQKLHITQRRDLKKFMLT